MRDLSIAGVCIVAQRRLAAGTRLHLTVRPDHPITAPLEARICVIRCEAVDGGFAIAATIDRVEPLPHASARQTGL